MKPPVTYRDHHLVGLPGHVENVLRNHLRAGTLISCTEPRPVSISDSRVSCNIRIAHLEPTGSQSRSNQARLLRRGMRAQVQRLLARRDVGITLVVVGGGSVIGTAAYLLYLARLLVAFIVDQAALIVGSLVVALVITVALYKIFDGGRG